MQRKSASASSPRHRPIHPLPPAHVVKQEPAESSPRAALAPLSIPDNASTTLAAVQETPESVASSPSLSSALSPTDSDVAPHAPPATVPPKAENPIIRRAISCSALVGPEGRPVKQRRKRSRVNPEQLVRLEEYFAADNSPTSSRRKDIAQQLGMDERQTQIWFQNRYVALLLWHPFPRSRAREGERRRSCNLSSSRARSRSSSRRLRVHPSSPVGLTPTFKG